MVDQIIQHHDWQDDSFYEFIRRFYRRNGFGNLEAPNGIGVGEIPAKINQGRWIVDCPSVICSSATIIDIDFPFFMCPDCVNEENEGNWYNINVPNNWEGIETVLLKRPLRSSASKSDGSDTWNQGSDPMHAYNRNWVPGEHIHDLQQENHSHGFEG